MAKKYELLKDDYINYDERILYRIKALITFLDIEGNIINAGKLGGYIENEDNLSQEDESWIHGNSKACGDTIIRNSIIKDGGVPPYMMCVVCGLSNAAYQRDDGIFVVPITALKD